MNTTYASQETLDMLRSVIPYVTLEAPPCGRCSGRPRRTHSYEDLTFTRTLELVAETGWWVVGLQSSPCAEGPDPRNCVPSEVIRYWVLLVVDNEQPERPHLAVILVAKNTDRMLAHRKDYRPLGGFLSHKEAHAFLLACRAYYGYSPEDPDGSL